MSQKHKEDLSNMRLSGDKIHLEVRPLSNLSSASRRSSLLTSKVYSRPGSAMPRLTLHDVHSPANEYTKIEKCRPFSAGSLPTKSFYSPENNNSTDSFKESKVIQRIESLESISEDLPSSNLLKTLINEPDSAWGVLASCITPRSTPTLGVYENSENTLEITANIKENTNSDETLKFSSEILQKSATFEASTDDVLIKDKTSGISDDFNKYNLTLEPGLTKKPPLPRKLSNESKYDNNDVIHNYLTVKYDNQKAFMEHEESVLDLSNLNFTPKENLNSYKSKTDDFKYSQIQNQQQINHSVFEEKDIISISTSEDEEIDSKNIAENKTQESESISYNNWVEDSQIHSDIKKIESQTDTYLNEVKNHCKKRTTPENIKKASKNLEQLKLNLKNIDETEIPNLCEIDLDELFKAESAKKFDKLFPKKISSNTPRSCNEFSVPNSQKKEKEKILKHTDNKNSDSNSSNNHSGNKNSVNKTSAPKKVTIVPDVKSVVRKNKSFQSKPIKSDRSYVINDSEDAEIETWINLEQENSKSKTPFVQILDEITDLEQTVKNDENKLKLESPKQTNFNLNSFSSKQNSKKSSKHKNNDESEISTEEDDITDILQALEEQDKTSQSNIKNMKQFVSEELSKPPLVNFSDKSIQKDNSILRNVGHISKSTSCEKNQMCSKNIQAKLTNSELCNSDTDEIHICKNKSLPLKNQQSFISQSSSKSNKYNDLLTFLDEVDKNCNKSLEKAKERIYTTSQLLQKAINLDTIPKFEDLVMSHSTEELASYVIELSIRTKDKAECVSALQEELNNLRSDLLNHKKQSEKEMQLKLKENKKENADGTKRLQAFIDQVMSEKKSLQQHCETLVQDMKDMEIRFQNNSKALEHRHMQEIQKLKDMHAAAETRRRKNWMEANTKKIKAMTVKSIEPEIQNMERRQQQELSELRALHKQEIEDIELKGAKKMQRQCETLREQLVQERERALAHEREAVRQRYEKLIESEERSYQEQRRRLQADHATRVAECEQREATAILERDRAIKVAQDEMEDKIQTVLRRHATEIKMHREETAMELEKWKNVFRKQQAVQLAEKEATIREKCKQERDREIEAVIDRLETDAGTARQQLEEATDARIKRLKEKYDSEIKELEILEKESQSKYSETKAKLLEAEDVILTFKAEVKHFETQLTDSNKIIETLQNERENIREVINKEYNDEIIALKSELNELKSNKEKDIEQLYSRVKVSLARKDEILEELTREHKALQDKCVYLENMIEQQRKDYILKS